MARPIGPDHSGRIVHGRRQWRPGTALNAFSDAREPCGPATRSAQTTADPATAPAEVTTGDPEV